MNTHARNLFGAAALFNFSIAFNLLFLRGLLGPLLKIDPVTGSNVLLVNLAAAMVGVFGYAYLRVAGDPVRFRPYIHLGIIGKSCAVVLAVLALAQGADPRLPLLATGDILFVALFVHYLRKHPG